jgi:hypothetical protein
MVDLLIAILISLGCSVSHNASEDELRANHTSEYDKAVEIIHNGDFTYDGGGVVILETGGD